MIDWRSPSDRETYETLLIPILRERPTTVFVGAGLSVHAGYPLLNDLINSLCDKTVERNNGIVLNGDWRSKAEICRDELGVEYQQILIDRFNPDRNKLRYAPIHTNLAKTRFCSIVTTNYDSCIELAFFDLGIIKTPLSYPDLRVSELGNKSIQHIHGYIDPKFPHQTVGSVILTTRDFQEAYKEPPYHVRNFLVSLFSEQNVVILGFSVNDEILLNILKLVKEERGDKQRISEARNLPLMPETTHFAVLENRASLDVRGLNGDKEQIAIREEDTELRSLGIHPIRYAWDENYKSVENIIVDMRVQTSTLELTRSEAGDII